LSSQQQHILFSGYNMKINQDISQRIILLRFPLVIGVVFIHAGGTTINFSDGTIGLSGTPFLISFVQNLISNVLARIAVPLFFLISGVLFFRNFELKSSIIKRKLQTRVKTLLIPYVLWNLSALFLYLVLQSIPSFSQYFSGYSKRIIDYKLYDYLNAFLAFQKTANSPAVYQFWFIRDLMILILLSPIFWLLVDNIPITGLLSFFGIWFFNPKIPVFNLSYYAIFFFYLGAVISVMDFQLNRIDVYGKWITLIYVILAVFNAILWMENTPFCDYIHRLIILPGILSVWYMAGKIDQYVTIKHLLIWLSGSSFFVYAIHEPFLLAGLKKIIYRFAMPSSSAEIIFIYLIAPLMTIIIALLFDKLLSRTMPFIYGLMTGGRTFHKHLNP
jgi:surface polysaccharide O-acyltransferase-like enzyme